MSEQLINAALDQIAVAASDTTSDRQVENLASVLRTSSVHKQMLDEAMKTKIKSLKDRLYLKYMMIDADSLTQGVNVF